MVICDTKFLMYFSLEVNWEPIQNTPLAELWNIFSFALKQSPISAILRIQKGSELIEVEVAETRLVSAAALSNIHLQC